MKHLTILALLLATSAQAFEVNSCTVDTSLNLLFATPSTALIADGSGNVVSSPVTSTELGFVEGVTSNIQTQLDSKQPTLTIGDLTDAGTDGIGVTGGTGAVIGTGAAIAQHVSDSTHNGYLSSTDWSTFNAKQPAGSYLTALTGDGTAAGPGSAAFTLATVNSNVGAYTNAAITVNAKGLVTAVASGTTGNLTDVGTDGIAVTGGTGSVLGSGTSIAQHVADSTHNGYLSSTDWSTFNGKQDAGSYITALTGDGTASGPGSSVLTFATVNSNVGAFTNAAVTVNAKGLVTAVSSGTTGNLTDAGTDGITITSGTGAVLGSGTSIAQQVADATHNGYLSSANWSTFNAKQAAGNYITAITGDITAAGPGSAAATLATVNSNVGAFTFSSVTVNAKGLVTAVSSGTTGNLTDVGTDGITVTSGTGAVIGSGTSIAQQVADATHNGYLSSTDWNTFNAKQATVSFAAVGSSANANGGGISAGVITLQPYSASFPGLMTTGTQTGAGNKTWSGAARFNGGVGIDTTNALHFTRERLTVDSVQTADIDSVSSVFQQDMTVDAPLTNTAGGVNAILTRTIVTSRTDTLGNGASLSVNGVGFTVTTAANTLTTAGLSYSGLTIAGPSLSGSGNLALGGYAALYIRASTLNTGPAKYGIYLDAQTGATANYGLYQPGAGLNVLASNTRIGSTVDPTKTLDVTGTFGVSGTSTLATVNVSGNLTSTSTTNQLMILETTQASSGGVTRLRFLDSGSGTTIKNFEEHVNINGSAGQWGVTRSSAVGGTTFTGTDDISLDQSGVFSVAGASTLTGKVGIGAASGQANLQLTSPTALTGTVSNSASGTTVTGVGTKFRTELRPGVTITANGETRTISAIASNTSLTTDAWTGANSGVTATRPATANAYVYPNGQMQLGGTVVSVDGTNGQGAAVLNLVGDAATAGATAAPGATANFMSYAGATTGSTGAPLLQLMRASGNEAAQGVVASGDSVGRLTWRVATSATTYTTNGGIDLQMTQVSSLTQAGSKMIFSTTANGTVGTTTVLTLDQDQSALFAGAITQTVTGVTNSIAAPSTFSNAAIKMTGITTGTNADTVCLKADGTLLIQAAACTISSLRFKENVSYLWAAPEEMSALNTVLALKPVEFQMKEDPNYINADINYHRLQVGLIAEDVEKVDARLAIYDQDGVTPKSYRQEAVIATLVGAVKEQQAEIVELQSEVKKLKRKQ